MSYESTGVMIVNSGVDSKYLNWTGCRPGRLGRLKASVTAWAVLGMALGTAGSGGKAPAPTAWLPASSDDAAGGSKGLGVGGAQRETNPEHPLLST